MKIPNFYYREGNEMGIVTIAERNLWKIKMTKWMIKRRLAYNLFRKLLMK